MLSNTTHNFVLVSGESIMSVVGGVNVVLSPSPMVNLCRAGMASAIGQCQTFSESADGYVRSEGCGVMILKNLKQVKNFTHTSSNAHCKVSQTQTQDEVRSSTSTN